MKKRTEKEKEKEILMVIIIQKQRKSVSLLFTDEDEEGKDEGDVWGHDGWDEIIHDSNPNRRRWNRFLYHVQLVKLIVFLRQNTEQDPSPKKEEASRYVPPRLRSQNRQEEWAKEQNEKVQVRAKEKEQQVPSSFHLSFFFHLPNDLGG